MARTRPPAAVSSSHECATMEVELGFTPSGSCGWVHVFTGVQRIGSSWKLMNGLISGMKYLDGGEKPVSKWFDKKVDSWYQWCRRLRCCVVPCHYLGQPTWRFHQMSPNHVVFHIHRICEPVKIWDLPDGMHWSKTIWYMFVKSWPYIVRIAEVQLEHASDSMRW